MRASEKYWNPVLETLPPEKLRQLQLKKFQRIFRWAYEHSKFHRKLYNNAGIEPGDIKTLDDIRRVPKVEKAMMRSVQSKEPYPYGDMLCVPLEQVTEYHQTSGTTGQPVYQPDTWQDWEWMAECWAYILYAHGFRNHDRVFIPFGYNIFIAFWAGHYAAEKLGCEVVPGGVLDTEARILKMQEVRATALMGTPTYLLRMAEIARTKLGIDPPRDLQIARIATGAEPGGSIPATKKRIEEAWGAKLYEHSGATEMGAWNYECVAQCGLHVNEGLFLIEIEDTETGELITEPDRMGKMVLTAFDRIAQPCIRFDSKDIIQWSPIDRCECGRTFRLLKGGLIGRADDITKVKGVLFAPSSVEEVVRSIPELGNEYEIVVAKKGEVDDITLKIELLPEHSAKLNSVQEELVRQLRIRTNLRYNLEFCDYGTLPRYEIKSKRFKDLRKRG